MSHKKLLVAFTAASALLTGVATDRAWGQTPAEAPAEPEAFEGEDRLGSIVVTARRRAEDLQSVPAAVTAITAETLEARNTSSLEALARGVPTLAVGNLGLSGQYFLRGVGSGSNAAFEQSLGVYLDGIYFSTSRLNRLAFMDQAQVEILRGPQSTLYAKGTIAGAITIASARPEDDFGYGVNLLSSIDGGDRTQVTGFVTGPLTDTLSGRVAVSVNDASGNFQNTFRPGSFPQERQESVRGSLRWDPTDRLRVDGMVQYAEAHNIGRAAQIGYVSPTNTTFIPAVLALDPQAEFTLNDTFSAYDIDRVDGRDEVFMASLTAAYDFDALTVRSVTGFIDLEWFENVDSDNTPIPILDTYLGGTLTQFSQELRVESRHEGPLQYIAGAYYQHAEFGSPPDEGGTEWLAFSQPFRLNGDAERVEETIGVFGQLTWSPIDPLRITVGARYQEATIDANVSRWVSEAGSSVPTADATLLALAAGVGTVPYTFDGSLKESATTPSATIEYDLFDGGLAYVSYRTGFKNGGFDTGRGTMTANFIFNPEEAESYEAGVKLMLLDHRLRLNINAFRTDIDGLQVSAFNGTTFTVGNAAAARSQGVEIDAEALLAEGFSLRANLSYLDAYYLSFPGSACYSGQTAAQGCVDLDPGPATRNGQDLAGYMLPFAPEWSGNLGFDYERNLNDNLMFFTSGDLTYKGEHAIAPDGNPVWEHDGYAKLDLRIGIGGSDERWQLALLGQNLTDERTANFGFNVPLNAGAYVFSADPPRTVALQLRLRN